jgi:glycosyltransferase involved in cell wall biosynthesis
MARLYPRADARVSVSHGVGDDLAANLGIERDTIQTIYNPVVEAADVTQAARRPVHPWLAPGEPPVILAVGRLAAQKDFRTLITAFDQIRAHRHARLLILGEGDQRDELTELVAARRLGADVDLPGWVADPQAYMASASVFVLSSRFEGLSNVLIEALDSGCPVVSPDCPSGPGEILDQGRYGALVPVGDPAALATSIKRTLDNPGDRSARIARAAEFSVRSSVDCYAQLVEGLLTSAKTNRKRLNDRPLSPAGDRRHTAGRL